MAAASASAVGLGEHTATRNWRLSLRKAYVVGPMAANSTSVSTLPDDPSAGRLKDCRNMGVTNSAAEGAKKTIHQRSNSGVLCIRFDVYKLRVEFTCRGGLDESLQVPGKC